MIVISNPSRYKEISMLRGDSNERIVISIDGPSCNCNSTVIGIVIGDCYSDK